MCSTVAAQAAYGMPSGPGALLLRCCNNSSSSKMVRSQRMLSGSLGMRPLKMSRLVSSMGLSANTDSQCSASNAQASAGSQQASPEAERMPCKEIDLRVDPHSFLHLTNHPARLEEGGPTDLADASSENLPCPVEMEQLVAEVQGEAVVEEGRW